jgi:uncharacterized iron-regulated membrane protein
MTKVQLRNLWFQIHKWIGLILAIAIIPICVTGAALVWHDPLERVVYPDRFAVQGSAALPATAYADAAAKVLAGEERLTRLVIPDEAGEPVQALATKPAKGARPDRITVFLDPADARVIEKHHVNSGIFQVMHVLHGSLMIQGWGRPIVGWVGVAMLVSSMTGLWLWWPLTGSVRRGFRWKRHANTDTNIHHLLGFWISVPLFILSLTGVWISFPQVFSQFDGPPPQQRGPDRAAMARARPLEKPTTPLATAIAHAKALPGTVASVTFPTDLKPEWAIELRDPAADVTVADATGAAKAEPRSPRPPQRQTIARLMRQIHDGQNMPFVWQLIVFLGGLLPATLSITGLIMWWRARSWRARVGERKRAAG